MKPEAWKLFLKKPQRVIGAAVIGGLISIACAVFMLSFPAWLFSNPFRPLSVENPVYAAKEADGKTLIIDKAGERLVQLDEKGEVCFAVLNGDHSFTSLKRLTSDGKGNIYAVDGTILKGVQFDEESVKKISPGRGRVETLSHYSYKAGRQFQMGIIGLVPMQEGVRYLYKEENAVLCCTENGVVDFQFAVPDAYTYLCAAACDIENRILYYTSYDGRVVSCTEKGEENILYDVRDRENASAPYEISLAPDGMLYLTDLAMREILVLDPESRSTERYAEEGTIHEREIPYMVNADYAPLAVSSYGVKEVTEDGIVSSCEYSLSPAVKGLSLLLWIAFFWVLIYIVLLVFWLLNLFIRKAGRYTKIIAAVILGAVGLSVLIIGTLVPRFEAFLPDELFERANLAAAVTAESIPKDSFQKLDGPEDFYSEDYLAVKGAIDSVFLVNSPSAEDLYCTVYRVLDQTVVAVCTLNDTLPYYPYDWEYEGSYEQSILTTGTGIEVKSVSSEGSYLLVLNPIPDEDGNPVGLIEVGAKLNKVTSMVRKMIGDLVLNVAAVMTVTIMVILELVTFHSGREKEAEYLKRGYLPPEILRMVPFLVFFLTNLTAAFFPLYLLQIAKQGESFGLSPEVLAAVPISAEVVSGALLSVFGSKVLRKWGHQRGLVFSSVLFTLGLALRSIRNIWVVTLGSLFIGAGWGVILLMANTILAAMPEDDKQRGFAYYNVAAMAGGNAGIVFGGFLIQWVSYSTVFLTTAILSLLMLWLILRYFSKVSSVEQAAAKGGSLSTFAFLRHRRVIVFFLTIVVPIVICGYFLGYLYPIVAYEYGLSETNIGYSMLIHAACVLVFSESLTAFFSRKNRYKAGLFLSSLLFALAFFEVAVFQNIPSLLLAIVILGTAESFGSPLQTVYYTELPEVQKYGYDRAIEVYSLFEYIAQSVGSFVFSYVLLAGLKKGLFVVLSAIVAMACVFVLFGGRLPTGSDLQALSPGNGKEEGPLS